MAFSDLIDRQKAAAAAAAAACCVVELGKHVCPGRDGGVYLSAYRGSSNIDEVALAGCLLRNSAALSAAWYCGRF